MTKIYLLAASMLAAGVANASLTLDAQKVALTERTALEIADGHVAKADVARHMSVRPLDEDIYSDDEWTDLGIGTMTDAWILAQFDLSYYATLYVHILENKATPGLFKLVDVYGENTLYSNGYGFFNAYNTNRERVDIVVDATDPDYVTVRPQYSGWTFPDGVCTDQDGNPVTDLYISSANVQYETDFTKEQIKEQYGFLVSTREDDVITIAAAAYGPTLENASASWLMDETGINPLPVVITLPDPTLGYEDDPNWEEIGLCTFVDGYFTNTVKQEYWGMEYKVPIQRNVLEENIFRLPKPFFQPNSDLLLSYPSYRFYHIYDYLVIDCTYPDVVFVEPYDSQMYFFNDEKMYITNIPYHYTIKENKSREEIVEYMRSNWDLVTVPNRWLSQYIDGVITIQQSIFITESLPSAYIPIPTNFSTVIDLRAALAGITAPEADAEAPVEYYNLQGMRINEPVSGQIVIKRQGDKTSKIIMD